MGGEGMPTRGLGDPSLREGGSEGKLEAVHVGVGDVQVLGYGV